MTEDEAKTKWCPFSRVNRIGFDKDERVTYPAYNRIVVEEDFNVEDVVSTFETRCCASKCMAWRWDETNKLKSEKHEQGIKEFWVNTCTEGLTGYCGLAGKI